MPSPEAEAVAKTVANVRRFAWLILLVSLIFTARLLLKSPTGANFLVCLAAMAHGAFAQRLYDPAERTHDTALRATARVILLNPFIVALVARLLGGDTVRLFTDLMITGWFVGFGIVGTHYNMRTRRDRSGS